MTIALTIFACIGLFYPIHRAHVLDKQRMQRRIIDLRDEVTFWKAKQAVSEREATVASTAVTALADDLAASRRANMLLRTGILDAEREVNEMADTLGLPIDLAERRAR